MSSEVRRTVVGMLAMVTVAWAVLLIGSVAAPDASAGERNFTVNIERVLVNAGGGIRVEGTMDCTAAVEQMYPNPAERPDAVLVSVRWDAYQYVGRTKVIHGSYDPGIAHPCWVKGETGSQPWSTVSPYPEGALTWVYSPDGRFATGKIHVEAFGEGGWEVGGGAPTGETPDELYDWAQADLKAVRAR